MSEARVNNLSNESSTGGPTITGITTFSGTNYFVPPVGSTAQRPDNPQKGALRFNTDTAHLEYYRGDTIGWSDIEAINEELNGGARAIRGGGQTPTGTVTIDYFTISTLGDAQDFGDLTLARFGLGSGSSRTRGMFMGGATPVRSDTIDYITISSTGDALDFGNMISNNAAPGASNATRAFTMAGSTPSYTNVIQYVTIASTGNMQDFGDMTLQNLESFQITSSPTRAVTAGGYVSPTFNNTMEYITIATLGNSADFGDYTRSRYTPAATGNATRGIIAGGYTPTGQDDIDYITIATLGNTTDFGGLLATTPGGPMGSGSDPTRACMYATNTSSNVIQYLQIMSTGNAFDFGDLTGVCTNAGCFSNGHGGL